MTNRRLLGRLRSLVAVERASAVRVLLHLNEVERRRLHLSMGYSSLFAFAVSHLGYSSSAAGRRIQVARCIRKYPRIAALLMKDEVSLSAIAIASRALTDENSSELLEKIRHRPQREVEEIVADYTPPRSVFDRVQPVSTRAGGRRVGGDDEDGDEPEIIRARCSSGASRTARDSSWKNGPEAETNESRKFRVEFAVSPEFMKKFDEVRAILSTRFPKGASFETVFEATMDAFLEKNSPSRRRARRRRRRVKLKSASGKGRHIPAAVRDEVYERDAGRCTYVSPSGRRCDARHNLQIDHVKPYGKGGPATLQNLRLLCAQHNQLEAEREYGSEQMKRFRGMGAATHGGRAP